MDNDAQMIKMLSQALIDLQVKYRSSAIQERMQMKPALEEALNDFCKYQIKLLKEGVITTSADLDEMSSLKTEIDKAANHQQLLATLGKTIAFIALRV